MITLIGSEKGGTGKTTISVNIAAICALKGKDVIVIDTDKQPSASNFFQVRDTNEISPRITCVQKNGKNLAKDVLDLSSRYDHVIIDAGGRDSAELRYSIGVADKIIIPVQPTQLDLWTLEQMDVLIRQARAINPEMQAFVVLNMVSTNVGNTDADEAAELIGNYEEFSMLNSRIKERVPFQRSIRNGQSVAEYTPKDQKAIDEITKLYKEVMNHD